MFYFQPNKDSLHANQDVNVLFYFILFYQVFGSLFH